MSELIPVRAPALRHAATRSFEPTAKLASPNYFLGNDYVYLTDSGFVWTAGWAFWHTSNNNEQYLTGNTSFSAAIEYPVGSGNWTFANECPNGAPITFDMGGADKLCRLTFNKPMKRGTWVHIRTLQDSQNGVFWRQGQGDDQIHPAQGNLGPSNGARPDLTAAVTSIGKFSFPPALFATQTRQPSALLFHDSREECTSDGPRPPFYDNGLVSPALARAGIAYCQMGHSGYGLNQFLTAANKAQRVALAAYFTHVGNLFGINDINAYSRTASQLLADDAAFAALFPDLIAFTCTLAPATGTSDGYATLANQTLGTLISKIRSVNEGRRNGVTGYAFCLDVADKIDPFRTGKWPIDRNPALAARATACQFTGSISGSTLTVTAVTSGTLNVNDPINNDLGSSGEPNLAGCTIQEQLTGTTGGVGTYRISRPQTLSSRTLYVGGYGTSDSLHQTKDLSEQVMYKLIPDIQAFVA